MAKKIGNRTVSEIHEKLVGTKLVIDGWNCTIKDTTETDKGTVYFAVKAEALQAMYLEKDWIKYNA